MASVAARSPARSGTRALLLALATAMLPLSLQSQAIAADELVLADPTIFHHDGTYYLYGTVGGDAGNGFTVYTSSDLEGWDGPRGVGIDGYALRKGDSFGDRGFWAPQVFLHEGTFYMAYTANESIAIASSASPLGPFTQPVHASFPSDVRQIDPYVFIDDDGKKYIYYVRVSDGNRLFVAELTDDLMSMKPGTSREVVSATDAWENTDDAEWPVVEGPSILQRGGHYYLVYSANHFRNPDYAVGYAVSEHPLGAWRKFAGNPILSRVDVGRDGTGHGDFVSDDAGGLWYVLHTHQANGTIAPRRTALIRAKFEDDGELKMEFESFRYLSAE